MLSPYSSVTNGIAMTIWPFWYRNSAINVILKVRKRSRYKLLLRKVYHGLEWPDCCLGHHISFPTSSVVRWEKNIHSPFSINSKSFLFRYKRPGPGTIAQDLCGGLVIFSLLDASVLKNDCVWKENLLHNVHLELFN